MSATSRARPAASSAASTPPAAPTPRHPSLRAHRSIATADRGPRLPHRSRDGRRRECETVDESFFTDELLPGPEDEVVERRGRDRIREPANRIQANTPVVDSEQRRITLRDRQ